MIFGLWHPGSGLGDQLFSYIATRTTAERLGVDFVMVGAFKGDFFIDLDKGLNQDVTYHLETGGKIVMENDLPVFESKGFDPEFFFIEDNTIIDGTCLQDERYWDIEKVRKWIKTESLEIPDDLCVINFRGGEFQSNSDLLLTQEYWDKAVQKMIDKEVWHFQIHTDDPDLARKFFPSASTFPIYKDISLNWRSVRYAKHLILSNSAFGILPALLNENVKEVIAPRYWARRNIKQWSMPSNYYKKFTYI